MNKLQSFCAALDGGFLSEAQICELEKLDRLFPVLVRCGCCRFVCGAQYFKHLAGCISAGGDYVRDVSLPIGWESRAASWVESCPVTPAAMLPASFVAPRPDAWTEAARAAVKPAKRHPFPVWCDSRLDEDCHSDAGPGL